ncbi:hypothetical protein [Clostridium sp.]|uniref:hypothetical protein n=1 Tax=Clostridium sp. TaxID=1506 RepID=UPI00260405C7
MDNNMRNEIESWGIPNIDELEGRNIKFVFNSSEINKEKDRFIELHCEKWSVKFCLYDLTNDIEIFTMEFKEMPQYMISLTKELPNIKLELLNVIDSSLRRKGIASYYIEKLKEYAIKHNYSYIRVTPSPDADIFKAQSKNNSLNLKELINFYESKSTSEMPIKVLKI